MCVVDGSQNTANGADEWNGIGLLIEIKLQKKTRR